MGYWDQESGNVEVRCLKEHAFKNIWQISISFINICIYFYSFQKYQKYQLPSHFSASLWDLHVCFCGSLTHAGKHYVQRLLTNQMEPYPSMK